jgi:hypothetical protein
MAFGEKSALTRYGSFLAIGAVGGLLVPLAVKSGGGNSFEGALRGQADRAAIGKPFDTKLMTTDTLAPGSKVNIQFALREMMRLSGQDVKKPDDGVLAAAECTLALANKVPLSDQAKNEWSAAQSANRSEDDKVKGEADTLYQHAGQLCVAAVNTQSDHGKLPELAFPVSLAQD